MNLLYNLVFEIFTFIKIILCLGFNELPRRRATGYPKRELTIYFYAKLYILFQVLDLEHTSRYLSHPQIC